MPKVAKYNMLAEQIGEIELNDNVFGIEVNEAVVHQAILRQMANNRLGTHSTKTRGQVRGGGRKPWKQKGTGRARVGSSRSPIWIGGGTVFGPQPRSHALKMPRKARRLAVRSALSDKVNNANLIILDEIKLAQPKTKEVITLLKNFDVENKKVLFVVDDNETMNRCARNIQGIKVLASNAINIYDLVHYTKLFVTENAVAKIEEVLD